jgi:glycosyltransferase involved in cell wall biosynthesis
VNGITVGIPAYNARKTLERALDSALSQTIRVPYEIIVVDDGSTDTTANIALSYTLMFPNVVRLIRTENRGVAAARNTIIEQAKFDHLTWLDADDFYSPEKLELQYGTLMMGHMLNRSIPSDAYMIVFSAFNMNGSIFSFQPFLKEPIKHILNGEFRAYLWASMVATDAYRQVGGFNTLLHRSEDTDWLLRYLLLTPRLIISTGDEPIMTYNFSTQRDGRRVEDSFDYLIQAYGNKMRDCGIYDEYVPRRYWEIANFYHAGKQWNEMWRCRALAAKHDPARFGHRLMKEIATMPDAKYRDYVQQIVERHQQS